VHATLDDRVLDPQELRDSRLHRTGFYRTDGSFRLSQSAAASSAQSVAT
jgi:hypothetical protein